MGEFSIEELRTIAKTLFSKAVSSVDPYQRLKEILKIEKDHHCVIVSEGSTKDFDLKDFKNIYLIGAGKASASMAQAIEEVFGDRITKGIITTKYGHSLPLKRIKTIEAGHPIPDQKGLDGTQEMIHLLKDSGPEDLVVFLLSGGASALLPMPADTILLEDKQEVTQLLLDCGADIREINTLRKHISQIKGGRLARLAYPSTVLGFILSDVVGDPLDAIGSGPTVPDTSTFEEAWEILKKYDLLNEVAPAIHHHLRLGKEGKIEETPKPGDASFERVYNILIGSNLLALRTAARESSSLGFNTLVLSSSFVGETKEVARFHAAIAREVIHTGNPISKPACLISGGETTVTIKGQGLGGRNQEFALAGAIEIQGLEKVVLLSGGTDGTDGPTDAAGALADSTTIKRAHEMGLDPRTHLENNNAYPFFKQLGDLLMTGPTRTNVMDVRIVLID
ncbi:MAG: glycerate kinase [Deltaproteobacteria bacterium RBG_16_48_10]|nr:MAG: glycerate kinase [Deltaproteobacteria bacterium RBG_16_48_10]